MSRLIFGMVAVVFLGAGQARAEVIFDDTNPASLGVMYVGSDQFGAQVTAAPGTSRYVTELDIGFFSLDNAPVTADLQAFLYRNDGPAGKPGTLLWQSAVMTGVLINSTNQMVAFSVPGVLVPDTFTFMGAITNPSVEGLVIGFSRSVGSASIGMVDKPWFGSPAAWDSPPPIFQIEGRVIAVATPEPSSMTMLSILGMCGIAWKSRRQKRLAAG